ncbi:hypothetical protein [Persicitalea jodogahamensis]|uniref:Uncharacterized protein n=1 Tax=Persicitalea jodogahamensis TaxID=402147 RepID=A0A8J3D5R5_9BACT|nr:hypothetical protein [Persicitalea jodogahamensis]GHB52395.1 hypothetical protein GCM10007390_01290 [Persicitalea jodogahamensis]
MKADPIEAFIETAASLLSLKALQYLGGRLGVRRFALRHLLRGVHPFDGVSYMQIDHLLIPLTFLSYKKVYTSAS